MAQPTESSTDESKPSQQDGKSTQTPPARRRVTWEELEELAEDPANRGGTLSISVRNVEVYNSAKPELSDAEGINARVRSAFSKVKQRVPGIRTSEEISAALARLPPDDE
jgi:hypothetical protein